jgi:hypothetical protein
VIEFAECCLPWRNILLGELFPGHPCFAQRGFSRNLCFCGGWFRVEPSLLATLFSSYHSFSRSIVFAEVIFTAYIVLFEA